MNLRSQSLDELVGNVQELATVASRDQVRSVMAVFARCTIEIADKAQQLSEDLNKANEILGTRISELTGELESAREDFSANARQASADINSAKRMLGETFAELNSELKRTREVIATGSAQAALGTVALVRWTKALVFVTIVYAVFTGGLLAVSVFGSPWNRSVTGRASGATSAARENGRPNASGPGVLHPTKGPVQIERR